MSIDEYAKGVESQEQFVAFMQMLGEDLARNADEWENISLASFLDGMMGWCMDRTDLWSGPDCGSEMPNPWRLMARAMLAARIYE